MRVIFPLMGSGRLIYVLLVPPRQIIGVYATDETIFFVNTTEQRLLAHLYGSFSDQLRGT